MELLVFALFVVVLAGCPAVWRRIILRRSQGLPILPYEPRRPVPWTFTHVLLIVLLYISLQTLFGFLVLRSFDFEPLRGLLSGAIGRGAESEDVREMAALLLANSVGSVLVVALSAAVLVFVAGADRHDLGTAGRRRDVLIGLAAYLALCVPVVALQAIMQHFFQEKHLILQALEQAPSLAMMLLTTVAAVVIAPLTEEFLFRGLLQGWLEAAWPTREHAAVAVAPIEGELSAAAETDTSFYSRGGGAHLPARSDPTVWPSPAESVLSGPDESQPAPPRGPIIVSSLIFAAVHGWPDCVALFFFALGLGYLYQRTHRLGPSIVLHVCLNAGTMLLLWASLLAQN